MFRVSPLRTKIGSVRGFLFLLTLILLSASAANAQQVSSVEDYRAIAGGEGRATYLDLLRMVFPELEDDRTAGRELTARTTIPLRHLAGDYQRKVYRGEMRITGVERLADDGAGEQHLLLLIHAQSDEQDLFERGEISLLALFRMGDSVRLLDAVDAQADRFTSFWEEQPLLSIGPQQNGLLIANSHHNSSQGYLQLTLVTHEQGRLLTIFEFPTLLNMNVCGNTFRQRARLTALRTQRTDRFNLNAQVRMVKEPDGEHCERRTRGYTRQYRALLVWNPAARRYEARGGNLNSLARFNERNF